MRHPILDMALYLLPPPCQKERVEALMRDQIEKISKEAVGKKREMRSPAKDKENDKVEEVTKKSTSSLLLEKVGQW